MSSVTKLLCLIIIVLLNSFIAQAQTKQSYPRLSYNGRSCNQLIIDRVPDYGISSRDGCIVMGEINLELRDIDAQIVEGLVKDAERGHALVGASIKLRRLNGRSETLRTDSSGRFLVNRSSPIKEFHVLYIGYRTFNVKVAPRKLF